MITPIISDDDLSRAQRDVDQLLDLDPPPGTAEHNRLLILGDLIWAYEELHHPMSPPTPLAAIRFVMEQRGLSQSDLAGVLGSRQRASEILKGDRGLSLRMIRALHQQWRIPVDCLVGVNEGADERVAALG